MRAAALRLQSKTRGAMQRRAFLQDLAERKEEAKLSTQLARLQVGSVYNIYIYIYIYIWMCMDIYSPGRQCIYSYRYRLGVYGYIYASAAEQDKWIAVAAGLPARSC